MRLDPEMIGTSRNGLAITQPTACGETESLDRIILGPSGCWLCNSRVCFVMMLRSTVIAEKEETVGPMVGGCTDVEQMHRLIRKTVSAGRQWLASAVRY